MVAFRKNGKFAFRKRKGKAKLAFKRKSNGKKGMANFVKKMIYKNIETKTFQRFRPINFIHNYSNPLFATSVRPLSPFNGVGDINIPQGLGQGNRIGNKLTVTRAIFRGIIDPLPYNATSNISPQPRIVRMWIYYDKPNNTFLSAPDVTFLQLGNETAPLQGTTIDMMAKVNTDRWRVLTTRTFKLGNAAYSGTGIPNGVQNYANNDFKLNHKFSIDITKYLIKNVKYNDIDDAPTTRGLFFICEIVNADGSALPSTQVTADMTYFLDYEYKDA